MEKQKIRAEIEQLIGNIKDHFDNTNELQHIPQLELKSIVSKIERLHQKAIVFEYLNEHPILGMRSGSKQSEQPSPQTEIAEPVPVGDKTTKASVKSIQSFIGINEKFQFIGGLFGGDADAYNACLTAINACDSFEAVRPILEHNGTVFHWNKADELLEQFIQLIKRIF